MIRLEELATIENYDEENYVATHPDTKGYLPTPLQHLIDHGLAEGRKIRCAKEIVAAKAKKVERIKKLIKPRIAVFYSREQRWKWPCAFLTTNSRPALALRIPLTSRRTSTIPTSWR